MVAEMTYQFQWSTYNYCSTCRSMHSNQMAYDPFLLVNKMAFYSLKGMDHTHFAGKIKALRVFTLLATSAVVNYHFSVLRRYSQSYTHCLHILPNHLPPMRLLNCYKVAHLYSLIKEFVIDCSVQNVYTDKVDVGITR